MKYKIINVQEQDFKKVHRVGCAKYDWETDEIRLQINEMTKQDYIVNFRDGIPLRSRLKEICKQSWATSDVIGDFVKCYFKRLEIHQFIRRNHLRQSKK